MRTAAGARYRCGRRPRIRKGMRERSAAWFETVRTAMRSRRCRRINSPSLRRGLDHKAEDFEDRFFEAGCDDATIAAQKGVIVLGFEREARNFAHALALRDSRCSAGRRNGRRSRAHELVSISDIANDPASRELRYRFSRTATADRLPATDRPDHNRQPTVGLARGGTLDVRSRPSRKARCRRSARHTCCEPLGEAQCKRCQVRQLVSAKGSRGYRRLTERSREAERGSQVTLCVPTCCDNEKAYHAHG